MKHTQTIVRILIADSSSLFCEKMKQIITENFDVTLISEVCRGNEVLSEISKYVFDVLIIDLELANCSGFDVLKKIRAINPDIPVLVMSMFPVEQYEEDVLRAGANGYISKAGIANELAIALHEIFEGRKYFNLVPRVHSGNEMRKGGKDVQP